MANEPLITWNNWQDGIAASPHLGHAMLQNVEIDSYPGAARTGKKPVTDFHPALSQTFTADNTTEIFTITGPTPNTGTAVTVSNSGGALPTGLAASTNYFVIKIDGTTFKLATTIANANAGTAINITSNGTGTNTVTTVNPGTIRHFAADPRGTTTFAIDSNGRVWYAASGALYKLLNGNTITNANGQGLATFRTSDGSATYLFVFRNAVIDVVAVTGATQLENPTWNTAWQSMNSGAGSSNSHTARLGQDNIIYFCDDRYIGSILEKAGSVFDPTSGATYTYNNQALDLPLGSLCYWLEELGVNLLISVSNDDKIYPWDRTSDSYGLPVPIGEYGGNKMKNIGNMVYVLAGTRGNIYWTQGTYVRPFQTIPYYATNNGSATPIPNPVTWGGIAAANGKLLVGVGANSGNSGVYAVNADGHMTLDNIPSTGAAIVTAIYAVNDFYQMGYAGGIDFMDTNRYSTLGAVILQSQMYRIGNKTQKETISEIEVQLANAVAGSVRLKYRTTLSGTFVDFPSATGAITTDTSTPSYNIDVGLIDLENIQFQAELAGDIDLLEIRCYR